MQGVPQRFCCDRVWTSKAAFRGPQAYRVKLRGYGKVVNHANALAIAANALAELQVRVVITVGNDGDPKLLGPLPSNIHAERFIMQSELLPHCDVVVSHGGSGTFLATLAHGLPQLVLPQGADQFINATALKRSGGGLALRGEDVSDDSIRNCVTRLMSAPDFRQHAARIAREISAMPSAEEVAMRLERLGSVDG